MNRNLHPSYPPLHAPVLVNQPTIFDAMIDHLQGQSIISLDTESNSLYRYYPQVCLIQLSTFADKGNPDPFHVVDYLIDPLALANVAPLGELIGDPAVEIILHAAENDILILQRDFHFQFHTIFDTQLAARIMGWSRIGLAALLHEYFGVKSDKRMQRTDWGRRPLTEQQIHYAQMDTHYLLTLRAQMITALKEANRWEEAQEAFSMLRLLDYHEREQTPRTFWQMRNVRLVPKEALAVLEALWNWREEEAQRRDRPPFKIATDQALIALATAQPKEQQTLDTLPGLGPQQAKRYGAAILAAISDGQTNETPEPPGNAHQESIDKSIQHRYDALRQWRTIVAKKRGVAPDIVFSNNILMTIAQRMPQTEAEILEIPEIGPWKAKTYGTALLAALHSR